MFFFYVFVCLLVSRMAGGNYSHGNHSVEGCRMSGSHGGRSQESCYDSLDITVVVSFLSQRKLYGCWKNKQACVRGRIFMNLVWFIKGTVRPWWRYVLKILFVATVYICRRYTEYYKMIEPIVACRPVCGSRWGHLPHAGVLQDTHDPLNPVHGHALLETAESWKRRKLYREPRETVLTAGLWVCGADGLCEMCVWGSRLPASVARKCWVTQGFGWTKIPN